MMMTFDQIHSNTRGVQPRSVLIVEDDPTIAALLAEVLEEEGYRVRAASDVSALPIAVREHPSVILLDLNLPGVDGVEIGQRLRDDPRTRGIPIVLMSASEHLRKRGAQVPVDKTLAKPFELDTLLQYVEDLSSRDARPFLGLPDETDSRHIH